MRAKHQRFVEEYLKDLNATQAAIRAGYSTKSAKVTGSRLLTNADVKKALAKASGERTEAVGLTVEEVLRGIKQIAYDAAQAGDRRNALKAMELAGKYHKLFTDKHEHSGPDGKELVIRWK